MQRRVTIETSTIRYTSKVHSEGEDPHHVNQYRLHGVLGKGAFGTVFKAENTERPAFRAIKCLSKGRYEKQRKRASCLTPPGKGKGKGKAPRIPGTPLRSGTSSGVLDIHRECEVLAQLSHKHVITLYEVIDDPEHGKMYVVSSPLPPPPFRRQCRLRRQYRSDVDLSVADSSAFPRNMIQVHGI